ncbi:PLP-dependent aminotransferase family protein, partial [Lacticaseibacillus paracasei]
MNVIKTSAPVLIANVKGGFIMKFATRTQKTGHSGLEDLFAASGPNVISFAG